MSTLREQLLQLKGVSPQTQRIYVREVSNYAKYFGKSPEERGEPEQLRLSMIDLEAYDPLVSLISRCGGTGRRAGLKIRCPQGRGSSTLPTGIHPFSNSLIYQSPQLS